MIATIFIVACHFLQYYQNGLSQWLNVGVQIFFILSGVLYGNKELGEPASWLIRQYLKI